MLTKSQAAITFSVLAIPHLALDVDGQFLELFGADARSNGHGTRFLAPGGSHVVRADRNVA
eukprot:11186184-Lingulodinium_polyedra.AAC.1